MKVKEIPKKLTCKAILSSEPISGVLLLAKFSVCKKNPYCFIFGPTNQYGDASITREEIIGQAKSQLELSLMDFVPLNEGFSGAISVKAMGITEIQAAIKAYEVFHECANYPMRYLDTLEDALHNQATQEAGRIEVKYLW